VFVTPPMHISMTGQTMESLLKRCGHVKILRQFPNATPLSHEKVVIQVRIAGFSSRTTCDEVTWWTKDNGCRVASSIELVTFCTEFLNFRKITCQILALGSLFEQDGIIRVPYFYVSPRRRYIGHIPVQRQWLPYQRFLMVMTSPLETQVDYG
jgi:hypothetical protein